VLPDKRSLRILIFLLFVLVLTCFLSPWLSALLNSLMVGREAESFSPSFSDIFNRLFIVLAITLFFPLRRTLGVSSLGDLGLQRLQRAYRDIFWGFFLTLFSIVALAAVMSLGGIFTFYFRLSLQASLERIASALLSAVAAGLLEEIFFRGLIFKALLEDWKPSIAFVIASFFYSALHFVKPFEKMMLSGLDPWAGFRHLGHAFMPILDPLTLFPGLFGLFLIGIVLAYAFFRTGSIYLSIGLHAGWIFGLKTLRVYGDYQRESLGWLFGSSEPKLVSGVAGWIGIVVVGVIVHFLTRRREKLKN
jgi:membrane protease YdiL (CAAX protease family)